MTETVKPDAIYTTEDVARILAVTPSTVRRHIRQGRLPASKIGLKRYYVRGADLLKLVPSQLGEDGDPEYDSVN